ncbi:uncharacterized protein ACO6RY_15769 [Pungitius sinensis]
MRIRTSKSEARVLSSKPMDCLLCVGIVSLPQVKVFKCLRVLFTSEGKMECELGRRIGAAGAVLHSLYRTVVTKRELSRAPGRLPWEVFQARPAGKRPRGGPRTRWRDYISTLAWKRLEIFQSELVDVAMERKVWGPLLELLPPRPDPG